MSLNKVKIGDFIETYNKKCGISNLTVNDVSGINREKEFFEPSRQIGKDTSSYKIVPPNYFACNLMHVGRDKVLPISMNHTKDNKVVSPAYTVFKIVDETLILKEYFFIFLKSDEKDRYFWFNTDASVREGMPWEVFCDIEISIPSINIQKKYVSIYKALLSNQEAFENGLEDLKLLYNISLDAFKKSESFVPLGNLLTEVDIRNVDNKINDVQGINIQKEFMPSTSTAKNLSNYKIIGKGEFAYSSMQTGRDKTIRFALYNKDKTSIISPAYSVLKVSELKEKEVIPEFIMMWFSRTESDRYGWFKSDSSVRANLDLIRFFEIEIPLPNIELQKSIVEIYKSYNKRKEIAERLKEKINSICPVLIKGSIEEAKEYEKI